MNRTAISSIMIAVFFISLDRLLKNFVLLTDPEISLVADLFILRYEQNPYIAFSIPLSGNLLNLLISFIVICLMALAYNKYKKESAELIPLIFIIFGAASNLYDRFVHGFVIDYFHLKYFTVFNIADCLIVLSTAYLLLISFKQSREKLPENAGHYRSQD